MTYPNLHRCRLGFACLTAFVVFAGSTLAQDDPPKVDKPKKRINLPLGGDSDITSKPASDTRPSPAPKQPSNGAAPAPANPSGGGGGKPKKTIDLPLGVEGAPPPKSPKGASPPPAPNKPPPGAAPAPSPASPPNDAVTKLLEDRVKKHQKRLEQLNAPSAGGAKPITTASEAEEALDEIKDRYKKISAEYTMADRELTNQIADQLATIKELQKRRDELAPGGKLPYQDIEKAREWEDLDRKIRGLKEEVAKATRKLNIMRFEQLSEARKALKAVEEQLANKFQYSGDLKDPAAFAAAMRELERRVLERTVADLKALQDELAGRGPAKPGVLELRTSKSSFVLANKLSEAFRDIDLVGAERVPASIKDKSTFNGPLGEETLPDTDKKPPAP